MTDEAPRREGSFRETARQIISQQQRQRQWQSQGFFRQVEADLAAALEAAYHRGWADAEKHLADAEPPLAPIPWLLIPRMPRGAFLCICMAALGTSPADRPETALWSLRSRRSAAGRPEWVLHRNDEPHDPGHPYIWPERTIRPLVVRDLLGTAETSLVVTPKGRLTWESAVTSGADLWATVPPESWKRR